MDVHNQCRSIVLVSRRPLTFAEPSGAVACTDSRRILGRDLEVSGGMRPIVHFKTMTNHRDDTMDHYATAQCCLRALDHGYLGLDQNPFLRLADLQLSGLRLRAVQAEYGISAVSLLIQYRFTSIFIIIRTSPFTESLPMSSQRCHSRRIAAFPYIPSH